MIESTKTTSMKSVSRGVLGKSKEHYIRSKNKAENHRMYKDMQLHMSKYKKMTIYNLLRQTYSPTVVYQSISKKWTNIQEASG